jgi:DNA-binding LacI/PurR family transcriptional regulator
MERQNRPTSETVSLRTGFSKSTISRALKGHPGISKATRERIIAAAREIGYAPNAVARSLVTKRSGVIGLILGTTSGPFYPEQFGRLLGHLTTRNLQLMMFHVPKGQDVADILPILLQYQLDGCLIAALSPSPAAATILARHRLPTVLINRLPPDDHICAVLCNNEAGGRQVAEYLLDTGHRHLAYVAGPADAPTTRDREAGFMAVLREHSVPLRLRVQGDYAFESGLRLADELAACVPELDAVFAASDIVALGVIDGLRAHGLEVPGDVSVVGFDGIHASSWPGYALTTVTQPAETLISRAVSLLTERIADPDVPPETLYVSGRLTIRSSTRARGLGAGGAS